MPNHPQAAYPFRNPVLSLEPRAHILKAMRRLRSVDDGFEMQLSCPMRLFLVFRWKIPVFYGFLQRRKGAHALVLPLFRKVSI